MDSGNGGRVGRLRSAAVTALAHPLRVRILEVLSQRDMSPEEFCHLGLAPAGVEPSTIGDHFRALADFGALELIDYDPRHGADERLYRCRGRAFFSNAQWSELEPDERAAVSETTVRGLLARIEEAIAADTFDARLNRHLTWISLRLDEQGWSEMTTALDATFGEIEQIRADAEARLGAAGEEGIASTCGILGFPSPADSLPAPPPSA